MPAECWRIPQKQPIVGLRGYPSTEYRMQVETVTLGMTAAAAGVIAVYLWRTNVLLARRLAQESSRIARLEHDLRSPVGVIRGFSALLKEFADRHTADVPGFPLRTVDGIDQAAHKMLQIIEAAAERENEQR